METAFNKRLLTLVCALTGCSLLAWKAYSDDGMRLEPDPVIFYKQVIHSPVDIKYFLIGRRTFGEPSLPPEAKKILGRSTTNHTNQNAMFFDGAISGENYFIRQLFRTNTQADFNENKEVVGRAGSNSYQVHINSLTRTFEATQGFSTNPVSVLSQIGFILARQFMEMGLGDVEPESITWHGNEFDGKRSNGMPFYGALEISNNLPLSLRISASRNSAAYEVLSYSYPSPPMKLSGFPSKITISNKANEKFSPYIEIDIFDVKIAEHTLAADYFDDPKFAGTNIQYRRLYSNGVLYSIEPNGRLEKALTAAVVAGTTRSKVTEPSHRIVVLICLGTITAGFVLTIYWKYYKTNKQ